MNVIRFTADNSMAISIASMAIVLADEDPRTALVEAIIQDIATEIEIEIGDVKIHLAAIIDPDHWSEDWADKLGEDVDVDEWIAAQIQTHTPATHSTGGTAA